LTPAGRSSDGSGRSTSGPRRTFPSYWRLEHAARANLELDSRLSSSPRETRYSSTTVPSHSMAMPRFTDWEAGQPFS